MDTATKSPRKFPKWAKITAISAGGLILLLIVVWLLAGWYINSHKQQLLAKLTSSVSEHIDGKFTVGDMDPAFFKGFPDVALELQDVTLSDSMDQVYHRPLMQFKSVYVKFNLFSLMGGEPEVRKVTIKDGQVNLFTDSTGYSNGYLLKKKPGAPAKKHKKEVHIANFALENIQFTFDQEVKNKKIQVLIKHFDGAATDKNDVMHIVAATWLHIDQLGFNLAKGGYLVDKDFKGKMRLLYDRDKGQLQLPFQQLEVGPTPLKLSATFDFKSARPGFKIEVDAAKISYKESLSILSKSIADKLRRFNLANDISLQVSLNGKFASPDTPLVHARWQTTGNDFKTNFGVLKKASFAGSFNNEVVPGKGRGDDNSAITVNHLTANYMDIPIIADSIRLMNLIHPLLDFNLSSGFAVEKLNTALSETFNFTKGTAELKVHYHGGVATVDTLGHSITGGLKIKNAAFTYVPHNVHFSEGFIDLDLNGRDLVINNSTLSTGKSDIELHGIARDFLNVYFDDPRKAAFEWYLHSDTLNLAEFKGLTQVKANKTAAQQRKQYHKVNERLALMMEKSSMKINASVNRLYYSSFTARNVKGVLELKQDKINLSPLSMQFADGSLDAAVSMEPDSMEVPFKLSANLSGINTAKLFYGLDNLGQTTLTSKNIAGEFSGKINISGKLNNQSDIVKQSLSGVVSFKLKNGELINFSPFETIQKFVFKRRNLDHIYFEPVSNTLTIKNGKVNIPEMSIQSTAINLSMNGTYAFGRGTDIGIVVPLRNPQKVAERRAKGLKPRKNKGIVLYLRARDDKNGEVKIVWDPLHKGPTGDEH